MCLSTSTHTAESRGKQKAVDKLEVHKLDKMSNWYWLIAPNCNLPNLFEFHFTIISLIFKGKCHFAVMGMNSSLLNRNKSQAVLGEGQPSASASSSVVKEMIKETTNKHSTHTHTHTKAVGFTHMHNRAWSSLHVWKIHGNICKY